MEQNRITLYQNMINDGGFTGEYLDFIKRFFSDENGTKLLYNSLLKFGDYSQTISEWYKQFCCDLPWAKKTQYCVTSKYSSDWSKYPCVVSYAEDNNGQLLSDGSYLINGLYYYANGRMWDGKTKTQISSYRCDGEVPKEITTPQSTTSPTSTQIPDKKPSKYPIPPELANEDGVKKFQDWLDKNYPGWHDKYKTLDQNIEHGYGIYGPRTNKAWNAHNDEYLKSNKPVSVTPVNPQQPTTQQPKKNVEDILEDFPPCVRGLHLETAGDQYMFLGTAIDSNRQIYNIYYFKDAVADNIGPGHRCRIYRGTQTNLQGIYTCPEGGVEYIQIRNFERGFPGETLKLYGKLNQ